MEKQELASAPYLERLNKPQIEAVTTTEGAVLVLSGAGTGKTSVLTARIAHLLNTKKAWPSEILAVTFTNKAAREMASRAEQLVTNAEGQNNGPLPWLGTFHSIAAKILRRHAEMIGFSSDYIILDTDDQIRLVKQILIEKNIDPKQNPPKQYVWNIQNWKDKGLIPEKVSHADKLMTGGNQVHEIYTEYQKRMLNMNCMDFGDLLLHCLTLFNKYPDILQQYAQRFKYIMVDEYQDTNIAQYLWLRLLALGHKNLCCVGDDDQSIYGWRGAQVGNILKFEKDFQGAIIIRLEQNYRSTPQILAAASHLINYNDSRLGKTLWTEAEDGDKLQLQSASDSDEEAYLVGEKIEHLRRHDVPYAQMAVLVRAGFQTRQFEERFLTLGLPYQVIGGQRFYERAEIRDIIGYLRVVQTPSDNLAFERIINTPKRGVGKATLEKIHSAGREWDCSLVEALRGLVLPLPRGGVEISDFGGGLSDGETPSPASLRSATSPIGRGKMKGKVADQLIHLLNQFDRWRSILGTLPIGELTDMILDESGYRAMWEKEKNAEANGRLENLRELVRAMGEFEDLSAFLEHVSLVTDIAEANRGDDGQMVTLMTLHAAKGLEFDVVFLPGWEEGLFPHQRSLDESGKEGLEEERRLAYVGITRARKQVFISHAERRRFFTKGGIEWQPTVPSRFITELPPEHIESQDHYSQQQYGRFSQGRQQFKDDFTNEMASIMQGAGSSFGGFPSKTSPTGRGRRAAGEKGEGQAPALLSRKILQNARELRVNQTEPEKLLWSLLRNQQLGHKFRRQHPIEPYIADFCCVEEKLIIELDGGQHNTESIQNYDNSRDNYLIKKGYKVLRFWNNEVLENTEGVLTRILEALHPHPKSQISTSPRGRGNYAPGTKVAHAKFGEGIIIKNQDDTLEIAFSNGGTKRIMAEFVEITR